MNMTTEAGTATVPAQQAESTPRRSRMRLRRCLMALAAAGALVFSCANALASAPAVATEEGGAHGDFQSFAEQLPVAEVHIDSERLRNPQVLPDQVMVTNRAFAQKEGYIALTAQMMSNTVYTYMGPVAIFIYRNTATLPDGTPANVVVMIGDITVHTGAANAGKSTSTEDLLAGMPTIAKVDGKQMSARVLRQPGAEGSTAWRYGLQAKVNIAISAREGDFVGGLTGMTIDRSGTTAYKRIPNAADYGYFSESVALAPTATTAPVYYPASGYGAKVSTGGDGSLHIVGGGQNGGNKTGIDGKKWDDSYLSGFLTEANAWDGLTVDYRSSSGVAGDTVYTMNTMIFPADQAFRFETSSGTGGTIEFTKNGGDLSDGSAVLEPGHYSAPRGKSVRLTMTPQAADAHPQLTINGSVVEVERHEGPGGSVSFTYDVPSIFADTQAEVTWTEA